VGTPVASEEEDSSTVFMAPPPVAAPPLESPAAPIPTFTAQDYEVQYEAEDLDATWRMPGDGEVQTESTASFQGFEEFAEPTQGVASGFAPPPPVPEPPSVASAPPVLEMPPPSAPPPPAEPVFEPYDPFVAAAAQAPPTFEPAAPFGSDQTIDSAVSVPEEDFSRIPGGAFDAYGEPAIVSPSDLPGVEPVYETNAAHEPFDEIDTAGPSEMSEPMAAGSDGGPLSVDDALIDKIAARVVDRLSQKIIQEIAWEVVPDLAEGMIQREIDALKAKLAKVSK
jgi:hypothetical protein